MGSATGGIVPGMIIAFLAFLLAWVPKELGVAIILAGGLYGVAADVTKHRIWFPGARRQVPETVAFRGVQGAFQFGFEMGTGLRTYMPVAMPVVVIIATALLGMTPWLGLACGLAFGSARGALHLLKWYSRNPGWQASLASLSASWFLPAGSLAGIAMVVVVAILDLART